MFSPKSQKPETLKEKKDRIFYHRAHKKLPSVTPWRFIYDFLILGITPFVLIFLYFSELTFLMSSMTHKLISQAIPSNFLSITNFPLFAQDIFLINFPSRLPSMNFSIGLIIFSLITIFILPKFKKLIKPLSSWIIFMSVVNIATALFFIINPSAYPYSSIDYSRLYVVTMI
ncbi:MAG: hypothetical protein U9Q34_04670, partial [Elusimicrobiota bacterium]|nr:hypothetical protein [Elusimicrobiota bacterium]